jgi:hypothetical protein
MSSGRRPSWRCSVVEAPALCAHGSECLRWPDHVEEVCDMLDGLDPSGPPETVMRALPEPWSWRPIRGGFARTLSCGCVMRVWSS